MRLKVNERGEKNKETPFLSQLVILHLNEPRTPLHTYPPPVLSTDYGPVKPFNLILSLSGGGAIGATTGAGSAFHFGGKSPGYSHRRITLPFNR